MFVIFSIQKQYGLSDLEYVLKERYTLFSNMKAIWNDIVLAESDDTVVVEGNHYFPYDSVKKEYLQESDFTTRCGWKGMANYYSVTVNGKTNKDAAWYYTEPNDAAKKIKGMIAFWNGIEIV